MVVVLHAVTGGLALQVLRDHPEVLGVLQELLLEDGLLRVRPHVLQPVVIVLLERVEDETVVAGELALLLLVGQQVRNDDVVIYSGQKTQISTLA